MYLNLVFWGVDINKPLHPKHNQKQLHAWFTLNNYCTNYSSSSLTSIGCESIVIMRPFCNLLENTNSCTALHLQHWLFTTNVYWAGQRSEESSIPTLIQITSQAFFTYTSMKRKKPSYSSSTSSHYISVSTFFTIVFGVFFFFSSISISQDKE